MSHRTQVFLLLACKLKYSCLGQIQNRVINHIAITVADAQKAAEWYSNILGFQLIGNHIHRINRSEHPNSSTFGIYPESLQELKVACMATDNGIGFEIIEFVDPKTYLLSERFDYQRGGFSHICVTDPDPDALVIRLVAAGGKRVSETVNPVPAVKRLYATDPWRNVIEILDISFERFASLSHPGYR